MLTVPGRRARFGGLETGGTWCVAAIGGTNGNIEVIDRFPTGEPDETLALAVAFFEQEGPVGALGIGSFGPIDADPASPNWGTVLRSPKPGWGGVDVAKTLRRKLLAPIAFDTDVNAAALAEHRRGAGRGHQNFAYVTVGTGVGVGIVLNGRTLTGRNHPEGGHAPCRHDGTFAGVCPYHADCLEGHASGPALQARWGQAPEHLADDHPAWLIEAALLGDLIAQLRLGAGVTAVVLSGGVGRRTGLAEKVEARAGEVIGSYVEPPLVRPPSLGDQAGVVGAIELARDLFLDI